MIRHPFNQRRLHETPKKNVSSSHLRCLLRIKLKREESTGRTIRDLLNLKQVLTI